MRLRRLIPRGPFWHHRGIGEKGNGIKLTASAPEGVASSAGEQFFNYKIAGTEVLITAPQAQLKGVIYNNAMQGQIKLLFVFASPKLVKPNLPNCIVTIGEGNTINPVGHLMWTWDGTEKQLSEQPQAGQKPDWVFSGTELAQGATELPKTVISKSLSKAPNAACCWGHSR